MKRPTVPTRIAGALTAATLAVPAVAAAEPPLSPAAGLLQSIAGLGVVLAVIAGIAWAMKRFARVQGTNAALLKTVAGLQVGTKEKIVLVEVGESWVLLGVAPGRVNALHTLPKTELPTETVNGRAGTFSQLLEMARGKNVR
jgi:flagellar protein FliO/FliZ